MSYINTTFAHGNGPYSRTVEWAIALNNIRQQKGLERLIIVVPLVYPGKQERILREEIAANVSSDFLKDHPDEIVFDREQGRILSTLMFQGADYSENLRLLLSIYRDAEEAIQGHLNGVRLLESFDSREVEVDLRDCELQLGLNNRVQTGLPKQFYVNGGAGPFDEILERTLDDDEIKIDRAVMRKVLPIARRMIKNQEIVFVNDPGVFSYDTDRIGRDNEILTPPFVHLPKKSDIELTEEGIYLLMTGIDGVRESGMYDAVKELGMKIYTPRDLPPNQMNHPKIVAQYARAGWSSVWLSHLSEKGFITPVYNETDDPEMAFNQRGIERLGLGAVIRDDPRTALRESIDLADKVSGFNKRLREQYGTLDGIKYAAEAVFQHMEMKE